MSERASTSAIREEPQRPYSLIVPPERLVQDWRVAFERALAYLDALKYADGAREALATEAVERAISRPEWAPGGDAVSETLRALREVVVERDTSVSSASATLEPFLGYRLARALGRSTAELNDLPVSGGRLWSMPRIMRQRMVPEWIERRFLRRLAARLWRAGRARADAGQTYRDLRERRRRWPWTRAARHRRLLLAVLVLIPTVVASGFMQSVLPQQGRSWIELAIVVFFGALFGWISIGFWTAVMGFFTLMRRRRRFAITNLPPVPEPFRPGGRTAIAMPICEEPVHRVFAGLRAMHDSLAQTGALEHFDFFVLSDSANPDTAVAEEAAWAAWCQEVGGFGRIFYRRRRVRIRRKSGNVADFCRRWGSQYRYMIMLDADSIMAGHTLVRLVHLMESRSDVGMIQTAPTAVNRRSLFARVQQFSSRVHGPMFAAGLHFWQLGDGQYWGHNTIIRIAPFMQHCALPKLPGKPPLGGEILSHDFVEAALMGRAGWTIWLAYDLEGSYEEVPSTLLEEMKRDRRWCQGNLQHLRLLFTEGLFGAHRALFVNGVLSYVSALLWLCFLALSTVAAILDALREPDYFPHGPSLFPEWPIWRPDWALALLAITGVILFLPKLLSIVLIVFRNRHARAHGGAVHLTSSVLLEILFSSLLAPIRMTFHSRFVLQNLLGRTVTWRSQGREDAETSWREAIRHHGFDTIVASAWGGALYWLNPDYFWWVTPIIGALILSIPMSVWASRVGLGDRARRWRLFLIPEESSPPPVLRVLDEQLATASPAPGDGASDAATDPLLNALHRALLGRVRTVGPRVAATRAQLLERAVHEHANSLSARERRALFNDPSLVERLHEAVWAAVRRRSDQRADGI
ncbi:MAG: glucans biosynthesis glucosyltransferase MdoH [Candidatus Binatia bacterium]